MHVRWDIRKDEHSTLTSLGSKLDKIRRAEQGSMHVGANWMSEAMPRHHITYIEGIYSLLGRTMVDTPTQ